ncbi:MAG: hypothetical protein AB7N76_13600 [Planctomycetota bacterium]
MAMLVNCTLLRGSVPKLAGNPKLVTDDTRAERAELEERVMAIAGEIQRGWNRRMRGVDVHALRKTHRSWAQARGVPPVLIDKQLGHADPGEFEVMRALAGSETGRKHYLDLGSELFDAGRSAQAVRDLLEEAVEGVVSRVIRPGDAQGEDEEPAGSRDSIGECVGGFEGHALRVAVG